MRYLITVDEANVFLQQVCELCVSQVALADDGALIIGLGPLYTHSHMALKGCKIGEERVVVSQYQLSAYSRITITNISNITKDITHIDPTQIELLEDQLVGQIVQKVETNSRNAISLVFGNCDISRISASAEWRLCQPGTEEDRLSATSETIIREAMLCRRWSHNLPAERNKWHTLPLAQKPDELTSAESGIKFLQTLVGARVLYGKKSPDMNLFDIGFVSDHEQEHITETCTWMLHAMCKLVIKDEAGTQRVYYGDCEIQQFEKAVSVFYGKRVREVLLLAENSLRIGFESGAIEVIPADDNDESWRLFEKDQGKHLVAANTWLQ